MSEPTKNPAAVVTIIPKVPTRAQIEALEGIMLKHPQIEIRTTHHFSEGIYAREILIPAGALVTGAVHKSEHLNILSAGEITVWTEDGMKTVRAPFTMVSRPGTKRIGLARTDCVWTTIHANPGNSRDLDAIETAIVENPQTLQRNRQPTIPCHSS